MSGEWFSEFVRRILYSPSFDVDNDTNSDFTIVKVIRIEAINNQGVLLKVVQALADLNLVITKAYITSDGEWAMDVFHVTTAEGSKLSENTDIIRLKQALVSATASVPVTEEKTFIELVAIDRPGLLSEIAAVLNDNNLDIVQANVWTDKSTAAAVIGVADTATGFTVTNPWIILSVQSLLRRLLKESGGGTAAFSAGNEHPERRLHQIMTLSLPECDGGDRVGNVSVSDVPEKDYTSIALWFVDRPKLLFDALCTITDLGFVVFHATILTQGQNSFQEYFVRDRCGRRILNLEDQRFVAAAVTAAMERRAREGTEIELRARDRAGLVAELTRVFRECALTVKQAEISTERGEAKLRFLVSGEINGENIAEVTRRVAAETGETAVVTVRRKAGPLPPARPLKSAFLLANFFKLCSLQRLKMIGLNIFSYFG